MEAALQALRDLVHPLLREHPRPWRIEVDWTVEVIDALGRCVGKFCTGEAAQLVIDLANEMESGMDGLMKELGLE